MVLEAIAWSSLLVGVAVFLLGLVILYFVIFLAVRHALRSHATWAANEQQWSQRGI